MLRTSCLITILLDMFGALAMLKIEDVPNTLHNSAHIGIIRYFETAIPFYLNIMGSKHVALFNICSAKIRMKFYLGNF